MLTRPVVKSSASAAVLHLDLSDFNGWPFIHSACTCSGTVLYKSEHKFDSGSGWPSFYDVADKAAITQHVDRSHGMVRTEITCAKCGAHLGHVFDDGPRDKTGIRHCVNGCSLEFEKTA